MTGKWLSRAGASLAVVLAAPLLVAIAPAPKTVVVRLEGNAFRPNVIHVRAGDTLRFVNGNGGPHNVKFVDDSIAAPAKTLIEKAMGGEKIGPMSSPLLLDPGEPYAFVVPALTPGKYPLYCLPHVAQMRASLIVDP
jgi:plastocyanin